MLVSSALMGERFATRWGLLAAALGMAIGTGNIWRFPRVCAQNGGGAFLIPWVLFLLLWSIPLLAAEFTIGRRTRKGLFGAFAQTAGRNTGWLGGFVAMTTFLILSYYAVVTGWCMGYIVKSLFSWQAVTADPKAVWEQFSTDPFSKIGFQAAAVLLTAGVVSRGVVRGVEKINKLLIPCIAALFVLWKKFIEKKCC